MCFIYSQKLANKILTDINKFLYEKDSNVL